MRIRGLLVVLSSTVSLTCVCFALSGQSVAQAHWAVEKTFHIGGEGGWDYVTVDSDAHRLYVPRSTHTMVIDTESGKTVADIPGQKHNHGVALVPDAGRGFISDGAGAVVIFDLKTNQVLGTLAAPTDADGIIYDKGSGLVLVVSGDNGLLLTVKPDVDPKNGKLDPPIPLGGSPEFLASDEAGKVYINLEDKNQVAVVDIKARNVIAHWAVAPGGSPVGMAINRDKHLLFIGCRKPQKMIVMSTEDGKIVADLPIGAGVDATRVDGDEALASCFDGKLVIVGETSGGKYAIVQTVSTPRGARTMDVDTSAHKVYLPTAELEAAVGGRRPRPKPGTFEIVVVARH